MEDVEYFLEQLKGEGIYIGHEKGKNDFIPWDSINRFILNKRTNANYAVIHLKRGVHLAAKISDPYGIAQKIYSVLLTHGDDAEHKLPEFEIN